MSDMASPKTGMTRWRFVAVIAFAIVVAGIAVGNGVIYIAASTALEAEENLQATLFTIRLVEQFVVEHGRWPDSWAELEKVSISNGPPMPLQNDITPIIIGGHHGFNWPACSAEIQSRVAIDFAVSPEDILRQAASHFSAIQPRGPYFEYRHYGFVHSLQTSIRLSRNEGTHQ